MSKLLEQLNNLENLGLVGLTKSSPDIEFAFKHIFTQESVYGSILRSERRLLHLTIGQTLEETALSNNGDDENTILMLAYHFEQAAEADLALKYLRQAAAKAAANYANREANDLYKRALTLIAPQNYGERWEILAKQEVILDRLGRRDQQANILTQLQALAELTQDNTRLATTHNRRAIYFDKISEYQAAAEAAEVGLRLAQQSGDEPLQAQSLNLLALAAWRRFDYPQVQNWAQQALDVQSLAGNPIEKISSLFHFGKASYRLGQYDRALRYIQAARQLTQNVDNLDGEATSHLILGWIYQRLGYYDQAQHHFQSTLTIRQTIGDRYGEATALSHLGWLAYDQQNPHTGVDYCQQALRISQTINDRENEAYALSGLGLNHEQLGNVADAASYYQAALTRHQEIGATTLVIFDQAGLARIALAQNQIEQAQQLITIVGDWVLAGNAQKFWDPWSIYQSSYQVLAGLGQTATAMRILTEAHNLLQQRAAEISDEKLRTYFLTNVAPNQAIEQAWQASQSGL